MSQLKHILPDYMLVFAVPILTHHPEYTSNEEIDQLLRIRQCLWFVLEPLMQKNDFYSYSFYKDVVERMKNHKDALKGEDPAFNEVSIAQVPFHFLHFCNFIYLSNFNFLQKMWAVCDLAMVLLNTKSTTFEMKEFITEARIPTMYFKRHEDPMFVNTRHYLPPEMYQQVPPVTKKAITLNSNATSNTNNTNNSNNTNEKTSAPTATNSSAATNEKTVPATNSAGGRKLRGRKLENTGTNETDVQVSFFSNSQKNSNFKKFIIK